MTANRAIQYWQLRGKLGIRLPDRADSVYLNWQHCPQQDLIRLSGPLGQGAAQLQINPAGASITLANGDRFQHRDAATLLQQQLGWQVPITALRYWIRGLPATDSRPQYLEQGFLQQGWTLTFLRYQQFDGRTLPVKIRAEHNDVRLTLLLKDWQLPTACDDD